MRATPRACGGHYPARGDARRTVGCTGIPTPVSSWRRTRTRGVRKKRRRSRPGPCRDRRESPERRRAKTHAEQDAEAAARAQAAGGARGGGGLARACGAQAPGGVAGQAREAAERAEAAAEKARQRKQNTKKAQKELLEEMRRKQEEESAHAPRARTRPEQKIREKARITCVATATDEIYEAHVAAFEKMKTVPPGTLRERDVPWPHPNNLVFLTHGRSNARKKKVMRAIQRWHPDKFTQNFGAAIREAERERIMTRVRGVSASVIELRQVWN